MYKKNIFITSTGTNLGKTYCLVEILKELAKKKIMANGYKPILSGFNSNNIADSDSYKILQTRNIIPDINLIKEITPWLFKSPIAPSIAAMKEKKTLKYKEVLKWCLEKSNKSGINIFEGAGGIYVPIEGKKTILNLMQELECKVVLIVGNYLGSVSHTISAIKNIQHENIEIINVIINKNTDNNINIQDTENLINSVFNPKIKIRKVFQNDNSANISFKKITDDILSSF
tara:strand:- start:891 stop:1580 length:690 start_codon:yes stop_codon:yes gene_type:complete